MSIYKKNGMWYAVERATSVLLAMNASWTDLMEFLEDEYNF